VIDEGQDLLRLPYLDVFDALLKGGLKDGSWRVFYDPNQNLFQALDQSAIDSLSRYGPVPYRLTQNCRNTAPIGLTTSMVAGIEPDQVFEIQGPQVRHLWYDSADDQRRLIAEELRRLLDDGVEPANIVLLAECRLQNTVLAADRPKLPIAIVDMTADQPPPGGPAVRFATVSSFKGLEAAAIVFFGIDDLETAENAGSLYVGASRATTVLTLIMDARAKPGYERRAAAFGKRITATF
jgi:hypothetical protein